MPKTISPVDCYCDTTDAARVLSVTTECLRRWRCQKKGPPYIKLGKSVRYEVKALFAWAAQHGVTNDPQS